jgi:hypothetical protein
VAVILWPRLCAERWPAARPGGRHQGGSGIVSGEMPTTSVHPAYFPVQPASRSGIIGPDLPPQILREAGEGEQVIAGVLQVPGNVGQLAGEGHQ